MNRINERPQAGPTARAALVTAAALVIAAVTWRLRPTTPSATAPDTAIVSGCAWLAWGLAGYLSIAIAATALSRLIAGFGFAAGWLSRVAPQRLRVMVDVALTLSVATSVVGTAAAAGAATPTAVTHVVTGTPLDWPGLADWSPPTSAGLPTPAPPATTPSPHHHRGHVGLVSGGNPSRTAPSADSEVIVQPGDTLWTIAARHLPANASEVQIAAAWHDWYVTNRHDIGSDPSLIRPGQRLQPPYHFSTPPHHASSTDRSTE